eukprot:464897-Pelagomonas_calceolata.AAC.7
MSVYACVCVYACAQVLHRLACTFASVAQDNSKLTQCTQLQAGLRTQCASTQNNSKNVCLHLCTCTPSQQHANTVRPAASKAAQAVRLRTEHRWKIHLYHRNSAPESSKPTQCTQLQAGQRMQCASAHSKSDTEQYKHPPAPLNPHPTFLKICIFASVPQDSRRPMQCTWPQCAAASSARLHRTRCVLVCRWRTFPAPLHPRPRAAAGQYSAPGCEQGSARSAPLYRTRCVLACRCASHLHLCIRAPGQQQANAVHLATVCSCKQGCLASISHPCLIEAWWVEAWWVEGLRCCGSHPWLIEELLRCGSSSLH